MRFARISVVVSLVRVECREDTGVSIYIYLSLYLPRSWVTSMLDHHSPNFFAFHQNKGQLDSRYIYTPFEIQALFWLERTVEGPSGAPWHCSG